MGKVNDWLDTTARKVSRASSMRDNYDGRAGANRREPKITQKDYLTLSMLSKLLKNNVEKYLLGSNILVLDLGCGKKPYQPFFLGKSVTYLGVDVKLNEFVDILCNGEKLPFKDNVFSICLCLQVLEHVDEPRTVIDEIFRVLKPSGLIFLSTHGSWPVHENPYDFWRWTEHGLKKLLNSFHINETYKCGGSAMSIIQLLELYIPSKSFGVIIILLLNKLGNIIDNIWLNEKIPNLATNYFIIARK